MGTHPHMAVKKIEQYEGCFLFVADILLHEMIHQYHQEITGFNEESYHGHGPKFRDECNRIGEDLGLDPVRSMKKRGKDRHLESCSYWPHVVRDKDNYLGVYNVPASRDNKIIKQVMEVMSGLSPNEQKQVLEFAKSLGQK